MLDDPRFGSYQPDNYVQERGWATAPDGTRVPLSIVRKADVPLDGSAPALLYGYGSYEASMDPGFSVSRISLLDRGIVYAVLTSWRRRARPDVVRTGQEACQEHLHRLHRVRGYLVEQGYTSPDRLAARGGGAGGLLMGAVANLAPGRFRAIQLRRCRSSALPRS